VAETVITLPGQDTLLGSWAALAKTSPGARLIRLPMAVAAVFPAWTPLNNATLLVSSDRAAEAASRLRDLYAGSGVAAWALWLAGCAPDLDADDNRPGEIIGLSRDTTTLVEHVLADARARGARTASLQSTRAGRRRGCSMAGDDRSSAHCQEKPKIIAAAS
jgi:hypothetical protein